MHVKLHEKHSNLTLHYVLFYSTWTASCV